MENNKENTKEIDLMQMFYAILEKKKRIILIGILMAIFIASLKYLTADKAELQETTITYKLQTNYTGSTKIYLGNSVPTATVEAIRTYLLGNEVLLNVIEEAKQEITVEDLYGMISLANSTDSIIIMSISGVEKDLIENITIAFASIASQKIAEKFYIDSVMILEPAYTVAKDINVEVPVTDFSIFVLIKLLIKYLLIGFIIGVIMASGIYLFLFITDSTIKSEKEIEEYLGTRLLASVPVIKGTKKHVDKEKNKKSLRLSQYTNK